jgi:beta-galactosidase beta subunit
MISQYRFTSPDHVSSALHKAMNNDINYKMNAADFSELDEADKRQFYKCKQCGEMVDMRQLDDVLFHEDHVHRADIQYGGSEQLGESKQ